MNKDDDNETGSRTKPKGFFARLNRAVTEVGISHFDDDLDWDDRVKLPQWQLARLKARHAKRCAQRNGATARGVDAGAPPRSDES